MHQCRLVTSGKHAGPLPENRLFLVAIPQPGDLVLTNRACYLVEAVRRRGKAQLQAMVGSPDEPRIVLQVRREGTGASAPTAASSLESRPRAQM
jgi:hypothetical protein